MGRFGGFDDQVLLLVPMGWACGNLFAWDGRILGGMSSLIRVTTLRFAFGMTFGVGIELLKRLFQVCSSLLVVRRHPLQIMWSVLIAQFNRISSFLG